MWIESLVAICVTPTCQFGSIPFQRSSGSYTTSLGWFSCLLKLCCKASMSPQASWISPPRYLHETSSWSFPWGTVAYNYRCHGLLKCIEISAAWLGLSPWLWYIQSFTINVDKYLDGLLSQLMDDTKTVSTMNMIMRESGRKSLEYGTNIIQWNFKKSKF